MFHEKVPKTDHQMNKPSESATCCPVCTCLKAFAHGGDAKNGVHLEFSAYVQPFLQEKKLHTLPLHPTEVIVLIYFLQMQVMCSFSGCSFSHFSNNRLLKSVLHDLKCTEFTSGCKALRLISKYVTTLLCSLIEDNSIHVMDI